jgi:hypothetical protein
MDKHFEVLNNQLNSILPEPLIRSVANTINLDYEARKEKINMPVCQHLNSCAEKIKSFADKYLLDNPSFKFQNNIECVLKLFCAGISDEVNVEKRDKNKEQILKVENTKNIGNRNF